MSSLAARKTLGLEQKLGALNAEFQEWLDVTEKDREFEKHHTQVRALVGHLGGLRGATQRLFERAKGKGILAEARNLEALVLGIRRVWEFFRSKLVQRRDPELRTFLQLADELAWACYQPVLAVAGPAARREPPLVFLNGGLSPYAIPRDWAFAAEDVPGEALAGRTWDPILRRLPIPIIGVPWYQAAHLPDLPVVAHETGHAVEEDFALHETVLRNIALKLEETPGAGRTARWQAWAHEVFADLWGCLTLGPTFVGSLMDFLAEGRQQVEGEVATDQVKYPTAQLRIQLCLEALRAHLRFGAELPAVRKAWDDEFTQNAMADHAPDIPAVVAAILDAEYEIGGKSRRFIDIPELRFTPQDLEYARKAVAQQQAGKALTSANTAPRLVAAARVAFEEDPEKYAGEKRGETFKNHIGAIVQPGERRLEPKLSDAEKAKLSATSRASGEAWLEDFASWAGADLVSRPE